jgi:DNA polymerase
MHTPTAPFAHTSGPRTAAIAIVGEAFGEQEDLVGLPFIGNAGQELTRLLEEAGIARKDCFLTNTFALRPYTDGGTGADGKPIRIPTNEITALCVSKRDVLSLDATYSAPALRTGKYIRPEFLPEVDRLRVELRTVRPNLVLALGGTALWALCGTSAIGTLRGTAVQATLGDYTAKVLPTYHPSYLFKMWSYRPIVLADLMKAGREARFPEIRRPRRRVLVFPTVAEVREWFAEHIPSTQMLAVDIETARGQITEIGFANARDNCMVVTLVQEDAAEPSYYSEDDEADVRRAIQGALSAPCRKLFQNGIYDLSYLLREGFHPRNCSEDTMLLHHSYYPEVMKGLGFLGSIYSSEPAWKMMSRKPKVQETKRDE